MLLKAQYTFTALGYDYRRITVVNNYEGTQRGNSIASQVKFIFSIAE